MHDKISNFGFASSEDLVKSRHLPILVRLCSALYYVAKRLSFLYADWSDRADAKTKLSSLGGEPENDCFAGNTTAHRKTINLNPHKPGYHF